MTDGDLELRNLTYRLFVELGRAPRPAKIAEETGRTIADVEAGWHRLHEAHAIVLDANTGGLRMANPFAAVPTAYRVRADNRWWYANCAWDAFGVCAALHTEGRIETACADCGDPIPVEVAGERLDDESLVFHCLVPASRWWDDIVFT